MQILGANATAAGSGPAAMASASLSFRLTQALAAKPLCGVASLKQGGMGKVAAKLRPKPVRSRTRPLEQEATFSWNASPSTFEFARLVAGRRRGRYERRSRCGRRTRDSSRPRPCHGAADFSSAGHRRCPDRSRSWSDAELAEARAPASVSRRLIRYSSHARRSHPPPFRLQPQLDARDLAAAPDRGRSKDTRPHGVLQRRREELPIRHVVGAVGGDELAPCDTRVTSVRAPSHAPPRDPGSTGRRSHSAEARCQAPSGSGSSARQAWK